MISSKALAQLCGAIQHSKSTSIPFFGFTPVETRCSAKDLSVKASVAVTVKAG